MRDRSNSSGSSGSDCSYSTGKHGSSELAESTTRGTDDKTPPDEETAHLLAKSETRYVLRLRILVFLALFLAALAVSLTVYFVTSNAEQEQFDVGYDGYSQKLVDSFDDITAVRIGAVANLAVTFTEFARDRNLTWPFVTMSDFHQRAASARAISNSLFVHIYPIVTNTTRAAWEEYSVSEKGWLDEGRAYQKKLNIGLPTRRDLQETESAVALVGANSSTGPSLIASSIYTFGPDGAPVRDDSPGPYLPAWQESPIMAFPGDLVNCNMLTLGEFAKYMIEGATSAQIVMGRFNVAPPGGIDSQEPGTGFYATLLSYAAGKLVEYQGDPLTFFCVPVFDSMEAGRKVVAVMFASFHWAAYFTRVLPPNSQPMTVVIENSCDGSYTYTVQGSNVQYVGQGNYHATSMSRYVRYSAYNTSSEVRSNAGINYQLFKDECTTSMMVYPTVEMYNFYNTNLPIVITVVIVLIFVFTAVMFFVYDRLVERRQRIVMNTAVKSSQIVSSLFPKQIRDRLFAEEGIDGPVHGTKTKLKSFLSGSGEHDETGRSNIDKPIADLCKSRLPHFKVKYRGMIFWYCCSRFVCSIPQFWRPPFSLPTLLDSRLGALSASRRRSFRCWSRCFEPLTIARVVVESSRYEPETK